MTEVTTVHFSRECLPGTQQSEIRERTEHFKNHREFSLIGVKTLADDAKEFELYR